MQDFFSFSSNAESGRSKRKYIETARGASAFYIFSAGLPGLSAEGNALRNNTAGRHPYYVRSPATGKILD
jgi:hypothetical protein